MLFCFLVGKRLLIESIWGHGCYLCLSVFIHITMEMKNRVSAKQIRLRLLSDLCFLKASKTLIKKLPKLSILLKNMFLGKFNKIGNC